MNAGVLKLLTRTGADADREGVARAMGSLVALALASFTRRPAWVRPNRDQALPLTWVFRLSVVDGLSYFSDGRSVLSSRKRGGRLVFLRAFTAGTRDPEVLTRLGRQ
jgi:hypothetical protein